MSLDDAATRTGLKLHTIAQACTPSGMKLKWGGFHWRWAEKPVTGEQINPAALPPKGCAT